MSEYLPSPIEDEEGYREWLNKQPDDTCPACGGSGCEVVCTGQGEHGDCEQQACSECDGSGKRPSEPHEQFIPHGHHIVEDADGERLVRNHSEQREIIDDLCDDGECPFCGWSLESRPIFADCDDAEIYCPNCNYVGGIE